MNKTYMSIIAALAGSVVKRRSCSYSPARPPTAKRRDLARVQKSLEPD
jgi:hypothetical protein